MLLWGTAARSNKLSTRVVSIAMDEGFKDHPLKEGFDWGATAQAQTSLRDTLPDGDVLDSSVILPIGVLIASLSMSTVAGIALVLLFSLESSRAARDQIVNLTHTTIQMIKPHTRLVAAISAAIVCLILPVEKFPPAHSKTYTIKIPFTEDEIILYVRHTETNVSVMVASIVLSAIAALLLIRLGRWTRPSIAIIPATINFPKKIKKKHWWLKSPMALTLIALRTPYNMLIGRRKWLKGLFSYGTFFELSAVKYFGDERRVTPGIKMKSGYNWAKITLFAYYKWTRRDSIRGWVPCFVFGLHLPLLWFKVLEMHIVFTILFFSTLFLAVALMVASNSANAIKTKDTFNLNTRYINQINNSWLFDMPWRAVRGAPHTPPVTLLVGLLALIPVLALAYVFWL